MYVHCSEKNGSFVSPWQKIVSLVRISIIDTPLEDVFLLLFFSVIVNAFLEIMLPHEELRDYPECTQSWVTNL